MFYRHERFKPSPLHCRAPTTLETIRSTLYACVKHASKPDSKTARFSLAFRRQLSGRASPIATPMSPNVDYVNTAVTLSVRLIRKEAELRRMTDTNVRQWLGRYNRYHDKIARFESASTPRDYNFVHPPPITTNVSQRLPAKSYLKPRPIQLGPWQVISVGPEIVCII